MAAAALLEARKRPAPDETCPTEAGKKRARHQLEDVGDNETLEEIGESTSIATELTGPSLRTRLTRPFSESEARGCMRQLLRAAEELHAAGTIHRDINPDSILVGPDDGGGLKIRGFGPVAQAPATMLLGKTYLLEEPPTGALRCRYCAPERLFGLRRHGPEVNVWSLGCVMSELLAGAPLFTEATEEEMITQGLDLHDEILMMGLGAFDGTGMLDRLPPPGREVLAGLLSFYSDERLTAADALKHPWFAEEEGVEAKPPAATAAAAVEAEILGSVHRTSPV